MFFRALRAGSFLRLLLASFLIVAALVIVGDLPPVVAVLGFAAAFGVSVVTAWLVGIRIVNMVDSWVTAARRAAQEDFEPRLTRAIPSSFEQLRDVLQSSRDALADRIRGAREEKSVLVSMLDAMTEGIIAVDSATRILRVNRVALRVLGVPAVSSPEDFEGEHLVRLVRDPRFNELVDRVLSSGRAMRDETEIHATRKVVSVSVAPIRDGDRVRGVVAAFSDNTELKKLERVRQDFITNVSHELKTPIAAILGWSETLASGMIETPDDLQEPLDTIYRNSARLSDLVDDIMTLARVEAAGPSRGDEQTDMRRVLRDAADAMQAKCDAGAVTVHVTVEPAARYVPGSSDALGYIARNLIDNAVKYSPRDGGVDVNAFVEGNEMVLSVTDQGPGIERHHLTRIFERFYRVDGGRSREVGGTGLGLSIVKNYAVSLGGRVEVNSVVGEGSTFIVRIPMEPNTTLTGPMRVVQDEPG